MKAVHHVTLATAEGGRVLRALIPDTEIGTTFSCTYVEPVSQSRRHLAAAKRVNTLLNRAFLEPVLGLGYPAEDLPVLKKMSRYMQPDDIKNMAFDFDFIGLQCYTREVVRASLLTPYVGARLVKAEKRNVPLTEMGWEVYPPSLYHMLKQFDAYPQVKKIIVTENGAAFPDVVTDGQVDDVRREQYLQDHIAQVLRARQDGVNVDGYFVWTLTDNFEWAEGYHARFGLIHIDFDTQERTIKRSGLWYRDFLANDNDDKTQHYENTICHTGNR